MDLISWIPALTPSVLFVAALWLGKKLIITRLTKSVEHEFNTKLETLRTQMRESEERLKAELRIKEDEIVALRNGALTTLTSRQIELDKRRLEAVDQLWKAVTALAPARNIASIMSVFNFEVVAPEAERNPKYRQLFEKVGSGFDINKLDLSDAAKARPFLSPMVWAIYSALSAITMHAVLRCESLKLGLGNIDVADNKEITKLIKAVLPDSSEYLDKYGTTAYYYLLEILESRLLDELHKEFTGEERNKASIDQASEIIRLSNEVINKAKSE